MRQLAQALAVTVFLSILIPCFAVAEIDFDPDMKLFGEVRTRVSVDDRILRKSSPTQTYLELRTRLGLQVEVDSHATVVIGIQDSRYAGQGERSIFPQLRDLNEIDLWQAYVELRDYGFEGWTLRVGRFPVSFGNERLIGEYDWHQVGRLFEGGQGWLTRGPFRFDIFWYVLKEANSDTRNHDFDLQGARLSYEHRDLQGELLWFREISADDFLFIDQHSSGWDGHFRHHTVALYLSHQGKYFGGQCNLAYQYGSGRVYEYIPDFGDIYVVRYDVLVPVFAHMCHAQLYFSPRGKPDFKIVLGVDYTSGDDKQTTEVESYDGRFASSHTFQGSLDYFALPSPSGLIDRFGGVDLTRGPVEFAFRAHQFRSPTDFTYLSYINKYLQTRKIGWELDSRLTVSAGARVSVELGFSAFLLDSRLAQEGNLDNRTTWGYGQIKVQF